jgi:3-hydroxybutyryl-CoA dehydrogenase
MEMNVGVIGSGTMGTGIAQVAASSGCKVKIYDNQQHALEKCKKSIDGSLGKMLEKGKISQDEAEQLMSRISFVGDLKELNDSDLIIEAIVENIAVKSTLFSNLEQILSEKCILATNTSSLSIASIAASCKKADRVIGIHFFNPAQLMQLVEIIPAIQTSDAITDQSLRIISSWNKIPVLAKDTPGFIVNRLARPFYGEALRIYEEGIADFVTIDWAIKHFGGFRMGPFELMDFIGNDINYTVTESVFTAFYFDPRYKPSFTQKRMMEAGYLGRKSGRGYYNYADGASTSKPIEDENLGKDIFVRILVMLINEAAEALHLNIATARDLDLAMTKGVNYPKGLLQWANELGIDFCVDKLDALYHNYHEDRYRCSVLLRKMKAEGRKFEIN